jgi:hypothetical protein
MKPDMAMTFNCVRYPSAKVVAAHLTKDIILVPGKTVGEENQQVYEVAGGGAGRAWAANEAAGFWLSFANLNLWYEDHVLWFVRRYGLVFDRPDEGGNRAGHEATKAWWPLKRILQNMARAWEPEDESGVRFPTDDPAQRAIASAISETALVHFLESMRDGLAMGTGKGGRITLKATDLASFMLQSALLGQEHRLPLRRCDHCTAWYYRHRTDLRYCSPSCRALTAQKRRAERAEAER